jgi:ATP-dependent protease La (LON) substrate-binding domain
MEKILPLFPLSLVVFPHEVLHLHIFEPRYKQLIQECKEENKTFGIPPYLDNRVSNFGTEMEILEIEKVYEDGKMDIKTRGISVFSILTFDNPLPQKLYAGGLVEPKKMDYKSDEALTFQILQKINELYQILQIQLDISITDFPSLSFGIAHRIGLSMEQEYELLCIETEQARQHYILDHFDKTIPVVLEIERTKHLIRMNGHFKNFDPLNF